MPRQLLVLNRFDGGINNKDSYAIKITRDNSGNGGYGTANSIGSMDKNVSSSNNFKSIGDDVTAKHVNVGVNTITQNNQDLPDNFLVKADNLMVDSIGKLRIIGDFKPTSKALTKGVSRGRGLVSFRADDTYTDDSLAFLDSGGVLNIHNSLTWSAPASMSGSAIPELYYSDGAFRLIDADLNREPVWFGHIKRNHFNNSDVYDSWAQKDNKLSPPTYTKIDTTQPSSVGVGLSLSVSESTGGYIDSGTYQIAGSFIYDNNQESLLHVPTSDNVFTINDSYAKIVPTVLAYGPYNSRISGARIYWRKDGSSDDWSLLVDIDMNNGCRISMDANYSSWNSAPVSDKYYKACSPVENVQVDTYETINGYNQDEQSNSIGSSGMGYKDSCIVNRRVFVAAPTYKDENGQVKFHGDRIVYSEANKLDTFLSNNYIDLGINDGDEFVAVEAFAGKLFAFKRKRLYIINIQSSLDVGWNLEEEFANRGVYEKYAIIKTDNGIAWVCKSGLFFFDGKQIHELSQNIGSDEWGTDFYTTGSSIGFLSRRNQLIILQNSSCSNCTSPENGSSDSDVFVYDFRTNSFIVGLTRFTTNGSVTNFVLDTNEDLLCYKDGSHNIMKWEDLLISNNATFEYQSKEIDFGDKSRKKKIYAMFVDYKLDGGTATIKISTDNGVSWTAFSGTLADNDFALTKTKVALTGTLTCNSIMIQIKATTAVRFELQSIEIDFRPLSNRKV